MASVAMSMILLMLSGHASAQATCTGTAQTFSIPMPEAITVPRDAVVGTMLGNWMSTPQVTRYYSCNSSNGALTGTGFAALPSLSKSGVTLNSGGVTYTVFNTNVPGVGVAIGVRAYANACGWQTPRDLGLIGSNPSQPPWDGSACGGQGAITNGGQVSAVLVKTGPIASGIMSGGVLFQAAVTVGPAGGGAAVVRTDIPYKSFRVSPTIVTVLACSTPNVTVSMGSYKASAFTGKGSSTNPVSFDVALDRCPAGMTKIQYGFDAPGGVTDTVNGVIALTGSTAAGIGLKLMDSSNAALKFDVQYQMSGYNAATGGSYTIPLKAAYYQTAASVTPGTANTVMTFTMTYQ
ncbi:fimbrial protein [Paraburkholderia sp.]|uniref:fimbrial protein n=1 Tax=Paraburkholderia sp. TaxID=1926495 RepID=UPI003D6DFD7A